MRTLPFSLVIPTLGIPELFQLLASLEGKDPAPAEVIVVIDDKGRSFTSLPETMQELEARILVACPNAVILHNTHDEDWQMNNQTFNIGIRSATTPYVYPTHDDIYFPAEADYFVCVERALAGIERGGQKQLVGATFPATHQEIAVTAPNYRQECWTQFYSAVASLLAVSFWREIGEFDVVEGIWWDAHVQGELRKCDCWMYYCPATPVEHLMNRALRANGHAVGFSKAPLWGSCAAAFERVYGATGTDWSNWYSRNESIITLT